MIRYYLPHPIHAKLLDFLGASRTWINLRCDADELVRDLTAVAQAEMSPDDPASILAELLGEVGRVTGRTISTEPVLTSLEPACAALAEMAPVLGAKVLELPRAVTRDATRDIAAEVSRQLEQASGVDLVFCVEIKDGHLVQIAAERRPAVPNKDDEVVVNGWRRPVRGLIHERDHVVVVVQRVLSDGGVG